MGRPQKHHGNVLRIGYAACYDLNVCPQPPKVMVLGSRAFGRFLVQKEGVLMNGLSVL